MTIVAHELKASYAFIERNFYLTRRYWGWELAFLVYSVAGALSISLIGADQGSPELLMTLMVGAIFWNYLSVVFSWIAETVSVERWEGTSAVVVTGHAARRDDELVLQFDSPDGAKRSHPVRVVSCEMDPRHGPMQFRLRVEIAATDQPEPILEPHARSKRGLAGR